MFSDEAGKYYNATLYASVDIAYMLNNYRSTSLRFECQPYKYSVNEESDIIQLTTEGTFEGRGSLDSLPEINVKGTGSIALTINGNQIQLYNVPGHIIINSDIMDAYSIEDGEIINRNMHMSGNLPGLFCNKTNAISFMGNTSGITIKPNWRWC